MTEKAMFGAGCFWGVEAEFRKVEGVVEVASGYSGGYTENPTYGDVCSSATGHAEVVEVEYDPSKVSYEELLEVFWNNHDPTQLNRQGPDVGTQYRSVIFFYTTRAGGRRARLEGEGAEQVQEPNSHGDKTCLRVLPGRGVPPALLREEQAGPLLLLLTRGRPPVGGLAVRGVRAQPEQVVLL